MFYFRFLALISAFLISFSSSASVTALGDNDYLTYKTQDYKIIFSRQYEEHFEEIVKKVNYYFNLAQSRQGVQLSEPLVFIFLSDRLQISNAGATLFPFYQNIYWPSGVAGKDLLASPFWLDTTLYHEITHIFQLQHSVVPKKLRRIIKSPNFLLRVFIFPFMEIFPNQLIPPVFLEGDAVLKESTIGMGGRLYSGYVRALIYAQIKKYSSRKLSRILINQRVHPHNASEKYLHGGYLSYHLQKKYSDESLNNFFKTFARDNFFFYKDVYFFNNRSLRKVFKTNFEGLVQQYMDQHKQKALLQKSSTEPPLFDSAICPPFNVYGDNVFFMTSNSENQRHIRFYNKRIKKWFKRKTLAPVGKLFRVEDEYYSRTSRPTGATSRKFSLFSESSVPLEEFNSKYVEDIRGQSVLYIDSKESLTGFKLYLNNEFYSFVHSNALFDSKKNIYYFKQKGHLRTLYRNKQALFSYPGYYGNILEIDPEGSVYFSGSTPYGSSIFQYKDRQVIRMVSSDTIIRARPVGDRQFLVCEITPEGYDYKIISSRESEELPVFYKYDFNKGVEELQDVEFYENSLADEEEDDEEEDYFINEDILLDRNLTNLTPDSYKRYSSLRNLRFSSINQFFNLSPFLIENNGILFLRTKSFYNLNFHFSDELQKNNIFITYRNLNLKNMNLSLSYANRVHRLTWEIAYTLGNVTTDAFTDDFQFDKFLENDFKNFSHRGNLTLRYPLFKTGYWSSDLITGAGIGLTSKNELLKNIADPLLRSSINRASYAHLLESSSFLGWGLNYLVLFPLSNQAHRMLNLNLSAQHDRIFNNFNINNIVLRGILDSNLHLGYNFYLGSSFRYASSSQLPLISVLSRETRDFFLWINLFDYIRIGGEGYKTQKFGKGSLELSRPKEVNYLSKYPLSLRRLTPFIRGSYIYLNSYLEGEEADGKRTLINDPRFIFEWEIGIVNEFLFFYNATIPVTLSIGQGAPVFKNFPPYARAQLSFTTNF